MERIQREFTGEWDIYSIVTNDLKLATLHELQTIYDTEDMHTMLEFMQVHGELMDVARITAEQQQRD